MISGIGLFREEEYEMEMGMIFEDESFDIVNASSVLHEVHDPNGQDKAIKEIIRVLKPGGYFYLGEWNRSSWQCIGFGGLCCLAFKKKNHWENLLKKYKFKNVEYDNTAGFGIYIAQK